MLDDLLYWVKERESIRRKKEAGLPRPWTEDKILDTYKFCNVRRKDDRVSKWLVEHVITTREEGLEKSEGLKEYLKFVSLSRYLNWPPTIQKLIDVGLVGPDHYDTMGIVSFIEVLMSGNEKVWTGAYMVRAPADGTGKTAYVVSQVVDKGIDRAYPLILAGLEENSRRLVCRALSQQYGWGTFMSGQVSADLDLHPKLGGFDDSFTWAPLGPGSLRGFNKIHGKPLTYYPSEEEWLENLANVRARVLPILTEAFPQEDYSDLTAQCAQSLHCEMDKYTRVKYGEGQMRSKYKPETAF